MGIHDLRQLPDMWISKLIVSQYLPLIGHGGLTTYLLFVYLADREGLSKSAITEYLGIGQAEFEEHKQTLQWCELISEEPAILSPKPITETQLEQIKENVLRSDNSFYKMSPSYQQLKDKLLKRIDNWRSID